jgi:tRNA-Thr(GGU) m(6)t(6)A37 methyltransferase TsaA
MAKTFTLTAVAEVAGGRAAPDDDRWDSETAEIVLDARFGPEAFAGLDSFSHAEVVFLFDRIDEAAVNTGARRPRGNPDWPEVGIFAQRGSGRPNRIGVTVCRILALEGRRLRVQGLDAIAGTPVLDVKPVLSGFLPRGAVREPDWARAIMQDYW